MLTQQEIDTPETSFPVNQRKPITLNQPFRSVECLPGCFVMLAAAAKGEERKEKQPDQPQERKAPAPMTKGNKVALWVLVAVGLWFAVNVLVAAVK